MTLPELQQAIVVAVTDVNAEKRTEGKSLQDAHEFRRIIHAIPQAIVVCSPDGQPVYINRVALEYAGLSIEEVRADSFLMTESFILRTLKGTEKHGKTPSHVAPLSNMNCVL